MMGSHMMDNIRTMGSKMHSRDSSCIYSVENQMRTLLSSPCQLRLGVDLSYHKWLLTICDGCFDTLKSSKMQS